MTQITHNEACTAFLDKLEAWLAGELEADSMWAHHDSCESCRMQARLARDIGGILTALPELRGPEIRMPASTETRGAQSLLAHLFNTWRQPLVFVPALATLAISLVLVSELRRTETAIEPELVIIDGQEYTREEIQKATADLELALRYIDKYRPARVISAELDDDDQQVPAAQQDSEPGDDAPTI